jgi:hypothetical protein
MIRSFAILVVTLWACTGGQSQSTNDEIRLIATVRAVVPLASFSGTATPVDVDPKFALIVRIESAAPTTTDFKAGAVVTLAIHSPSLLFGGEATNGKDYEFRLRRKIEDGKVRFYALTVRRPLTPEKVASP